MLALRRPQRLGLQAVLDLFCPVFVDVSTRLSHVVRKFVQSGERLSAMDLSNGIPVEEDALPGEQTALLAISAAEDLFIAVQGLIAHPARGIRAGTALAESEALPEGVLCHLNALSDRPGWAETLLKGYTPDALPIQAGLFRRS